MGVSTAQVKGELGKIGDNMSKLLEIFEKYGARLEELKGSLKAPEDDGQSPAESEAL